MAAGAKSVILLCLVAITFTSLWFLKPRFDNDIQLKCFRSWIEAKIGEDVVLSCKANATVKKGATSWEDVDYVRDIDLNEDGRYVSLANGSLQIKNIVREDFGLYICDDEESGERIQTKLTLDDEFAWIYVAVYAMVALVILSLLYLIIIILIVWVTECRFAEPFTFKSNEKSCSWFLNLWNSIKSFGKACKHRLSVVWWNHIDGSDDDDCCVSRISFFFKAVKTVFFKIVICALDVVADIIQVVIYCKNEDYVWAYFTGFFVFFPFILSIFFKFRHVSKELKSKPSQPCMEIIGRICQAIFCDCLCHLPIVQLWKHGKVTCEVLCLEWKLLEKSVETKKKLRESTRDANGNVQEGHPSLADAGDAMEMQVPESNTGTSDEGQVVSNTQASSKKFQKPEDVYKNYLNYKKKIKRDIAAVESEFREFTVLECMGESVPQSILQMGLLLRATPNTLGSIINILTNWTVLTSILTMVQTFTNIFLNMPYGKPEAKDEPSDQRTAEEGQVQQSSVTNNDNHDSSEAQQSDETGSTSCLPCLKKKKCSCWPSFSCGTKDEPSDQRTAEEGQAQQSSMTNNDNHDTSETQQSDETSKTSCWPSFSCGTKDEPSDQRTAEEGQVQQSSVTNNDNHDTSEAQQSDETGNTSCLPCLKKKKCSCWPSSLCGTKSKKKQRPNLNFPYGTSKGSILIGPVMLATILPRAFNLALIFTLEMVWMWIAFSIFGILFAIYWKLYHFIFKVRQKKWLKSDKFIYSLILSIIAPCVRLYPDTKSSIGASSALSVGFHCILLTIIWPLTQTTPMIFTPCVDVEFYHKLCGFSAIMLFISVLFSGILYLFSDGEFRQLMGLVGWPFDSPLSCPQMDVYKTAVEKKWMNVLKHLIKADIERIRDIDDPERIETKLKKKGRINWTLKENQTAVHKACSDSRNAELVKLFLKAPPKLGHFQAKDKNSMTPLHVACSKGLKDIVKLILENGRHLAKDKVMERTPLMIACANSNLDLVELLLEQADQINFGAKDTKKQQNVWHILAKGDEEKLKIMRCCVRKWRGEHINEKDKDGRTPFLVSCTASNDLAFKWFLKHSEKFNIELDAVDGHGMNGRQLACKYNATKIIKEFVHKGYYGDGELRNDGRKEFTEQFKSETWKIYVTVDASGYPTEVDVKKMFNNVEKMVNDDIDLDLDLDLDAFFEE